MSSTERLLNTIKNGISPFHVAAEAIRQLEEADFEKLDLGSEWDLCPGKGYYLCPFGTAVIAFKVNEEVESEDILKICAAHIDSPSPRLKANPLTSSAGLMKLNAEMYGGAIFSTWMDRPLSLAGRVYTKGNRIKTPECHLVDFGKNVAIIPNLPIHMNRKANEGVELNAQTDLQPIAGLAGEDFTKDYFNSILAEKIGVEPEDILSYELVFYNNDECCVTGFDDSMLCGPRIDNLSSVAACLSGIIDSSRSSGIDVIALFDHEEIGSRTKGGAGSNLLMNVLERIYDSLGFTRSDFLRAVSTGSFLSVDVAHATHPAHPEKYDSTSGIAMGSGIALKTASKQNYCGDAEIAAILHGLCDAYKIPLTTTYLRSDQPGGSTLGSILSASLPMSCADIGIPILAMHSCVETMAISDYENLEKLLTFYFTEL